VDVREVLEALFQVSGGGLHGRIYMSSVWTSDVYAVDGTRIRFLKAQP
jgi:hypothetical protein